MSKIWILLGLLWLTRIVANILSYIHLWYMKEYRMDRMLIHLKNPLNLKHLLFLPYKIPPPTTPKTFVLFSVSLICVAVPLFIFINRWLVLIIIDISSFVLISLLVMILNCVTVVSHRFQIYRAVKKLRRHAPITVIGVTGSYGKTSVKEYITTLVSEQYATIKTESSRNSPIAIAEVILTKLKPFHQMFVVEMGAYKRGEIAKMCQMVRPQIGVVTAISAQHQDLFKNIETTFAAKYELIQNLTGKKIAIFNGDNIYTIKMSQRAKRDGYKVWVYTTNKTNKFPWADNIGLIENVTAGIDSIDFDLQFIKHKTHFSSRVIGEHQAGNITAAVLAAYACDIPLKLVSRFSEKLYSVSQRMQIIRGYNGATYIDDTFNNGLEASIAAIKYLGKKKGRKFLVYQPMIELGQFAETSHIKVGEVAANNCDEIYLTNTNYYESFMTGVKKVKRDVEIYVINAKKAAQQIKSRINHKDMVVFKGKEAETVLNLCRV